SPAETAGADPQPAPPDRDFTAREALHTPAFWLLALGHGFALFVVSAVNVHAITHMKEGLGYSLEAGSFVGDRYDKRMLSAACMFMHMAGLLSLTYAVNHAMVIAFAVMHGFGWGLRGPFMQALRADYFGRSAIGMILGLSFMIV